MVFTHTVYRVRRSFRQRARFWTSELLLSMRIWVIRIEIYVKHPLCMMQLFLETSHESDISHLHFIDFKNLCLAFNLAMLISSSSKQHFEMFFLIFSLRRRLTFRSDCPQWRQFEWNVKQCFHVEVRKYHSLMSASIASTMLKVKTDSFYIQINHPLIDTFLLFISANNAVPSKIQGCKTSGLFIRLDK